MFGLWKTIKKYFLFYFSVYWSFVIFSCLYLTSVLHFYLKIYQLSTSLIISLNLLSFVVSACDTLRDIFPFTLSISFTQLSLILLSELFYESQNSILNGSTSLFERNFSYLIKSFIEIVSRNFCCHRSFY